MRIVNLPYYLTGDKWEAEELLRSEPSHLGLPPRYRSRRALVAITFASIQDTDSAPEAMVQKAESTMDKAETSASSDKFRIYKVF